MNIVERAAKAILELHPSWSWEKANEATRRYYRELARAAIIAMREPTEAMLLAGWGRFAKDAGLATWQAMIDEAVR